MLAAMHCCHQSLALLQERAELAKALEEERANNSTGKVQLQQAATAAQQRADKMAELVRHGLCGLLCYLHGRPGYRHIQLSVGS